MVILFRVEDRRQERWRLRMERRLDREAEVVDKPEDVLEELVEEGAYLLEALAMLRASSLKARMRVEQVTNRYRRMSRRRI